MRLERLDQSSATNVSNSSCHKDEVNQPTAIEATTSRIMQSLLNNDCDHGYNGKWAHLVFSRANI